MSKEKLTFAVDFDGCLTEYSFPDIGLQSDEQKELLNVLIKLKEQGHKLILWTSRGEPALQEAIEWCTDHKLEFDDININPFFDKKSALLNLVFFKNNFVFLNIVCLCMGKKKFLV